MIFFDRAVIPQSPHSGTTGIKKEEEEEKKLILRGKGVHMYLVRWWLRSDPNLGLSSGTYSVERSVDSIGIFTA